MLAALNRWWREERRRAHKAALVARLLRLNDHHLADLGLRRDQLQPDGIRELDLPAPRPTPARAPRRRTAVRPSLQGCG